MTDRLVPLKLVTNCVITGPAPENFTCWSDYFNFVQKSGIMSGLKISALPHKNLATEEEKLSTTFDLRPLWLVIEDSENELLAKEKETGECFDDGQFNAARIRAIRDWLFPETGPLDSMWFGTLVEHEHNFKEQLRSLLTAEADSAERNDG